MSKRLLISILASIIALSVIGQNILNAPYSRFGFGTIENQNYMAIRQMGSLGSSWTDNMHINAVNPASLPYLTSTAYEVGVSGTNVTLDNGTNSTNQWGGNIDYLGIAFPLFNPINDVYENYQRKWKFGMGFNLARRSTVGYDITSIDSTAELGRFDRTYQGQGGTYEFKWSNGVHYKDISFGFGVGYLFGNTSFDRNVIFRDKELSFDDVFSNSFFVRGFTYNVGAMYMLKLNKPENTDQLKKITFGVRYNGGTNFTTIGEELALGIQTFPDGRIIRDTISSKLDTRAKGFLPGTFGIGANYKYGSKFGIGVEYNTTPWSQYFNESKGDVKNALTDGYFVSIGGFYRPNYKSYDNFFERVSYRVGGFYEKDGRQEGGNDINRVGATFGLGLPFIYQRRISNVSLGLEYGQRGMGTQIEETYLNINIGLTFNDGEWFIKRKYN